MKNIDKEEVLKKITGGSGGKLVTAEVFREIISPMCESTLMNNIECFLCISDSLPEPVEKYEEVAREVLKKYNIEMRGREFYRNGEKIIKSIMGY